MKPDLQPYKIETLYVAIAVGEGEQEGHEGIFGMMADGVWTPMVFTNPARVDGFKEILNHIAKVGGTKVAFRSYTLTEEIPL